MEAKDLMVGDWVYTRAKKRKVKVLGVRVDTDCPVVLTDFGDVWWPTAEFEPIPLNGEILEKSGFENTSETPLYTEYRLHISEHNAFMFVTFTKSEPVRVKVYFVESKTYRKFSFDVHKKMSVHDLQHAMRMCGIEKEIIL